MDKYGLIGYPLGHSFSRQFFTEKFAREGIDAVYENYEIADASQLIDIVIHNPELRGLNCTIPHKQAIIPLLDELSDEAREIGAVNVVCICRNTPVTLSDGTQRPRLKGYNSDAIGFANSIKPLLTLNHHNALVLGTGGASRAICFALTKLGIQWTYVSRSRKPGMMCYDDITPETLRHYEVVVNCSPVGMYPHIDEAPRLPYEAMDERHLLYDLVYNPEMTEFMKRGAERGATVKNGLEMLHLQAIASWEIWNGR